MPLRKNNAFIDFCLRQKDLRPEWSGKSLSELVPLCSSLWMEKGADERRLESALHATASAMIGRQLLPQSAENMRLIDLFMRQDVEKASLNHDHPIHIVYVNIWCVAPNRKVFPAELGLVELTLREGILRRWNQMISPEGLPARFGLSLKARSDAGHKLTQFHPDLSNCFADIVETLKRILTSKDGSYAGRDTYEEKFNLAAFAAAQKYNLLPIYALSEHRQQVADSLEWLCEAAETDVRFAVYDISHLASSMMKSVTPEQMMPPAAALIPLRKETHLFVPGVDCPFHRHVESSQCACGRATRVALNLLQMLHDHQVFNTPLIEGRHVPYKEAKAAMSFMKFIKTCELHYRDVDHATDPHTSSVDTLVDLPASIFSLSADPDPFCSYSTSKDLLDAEAS